VTIGNLALRDKLMGRKFRGLTRSTITGVTGSRAEVDLAVVRKLQLGPIVLENVTIAFADVPPFAVFGLSERPALLLGTDIMASFRKVSLDFRARKVRFQLRRCYAVTAQLTMRTIERARLFPEQGSSSACRE
jgi:hypothetical protein